ncbi:hypothetical protein ACFPRL_24480 [Pseudoclavibacter helvolus]
MVTLTPGKVARGGSWQAWRRAWTPFPSARRGSHTTTSTSASQTARSRRVIALCSARSPARSA